MKYFSPTSVEEAVGLLASGGARVFAGATDVIPQLRAGRPEPDSLVDLKRIARLTSLTTHDSGWTIGAATPTVRLTEDGELAATFPGLIEAAGLIGSDQIQSRCSLGGNLCNASPAADSVPAMLVNRMRAVIATGADTRTIPVEDVVTGPGRTSLGPGEFIVEFELDHPPARTCDAYLRFIPRTEMDIAVVGAGARVTLDEAGRCASAVIALGAVAPTVVRVTDAEAAVAGKSLDDDATMAAVAAAASAACNPIDDKRGTIAYRRHVAGVLARRALTLAAQRAAVHASERHGGAR